MKQLNIYFGAQRDPGFGWGTSADILKCAVPDDFSSASLTEERQWVSIKLESGVKFINTANILWFDLLDEVEQLQEPKCAAKKSDAPEKTVGPQKLYDAVESVFGNALFK